MTASGDWGVAGAGQCRGRDECRQAGRRLGLGRNARFFLRACLALTFKRRALVAEAAVIAVEPLSLLAVLVAVVIGALVTRRPVLTVGTFLAMATRRFDAENRP